MPGQSGHLRLVSTHVDVLEFDTINYEVLYPFRRWSEGSRGPSICNLSYEPEDLAVVEYQRLVASVDCSMKQPHRPIPARNDPIERDVMAALGYTQGNSLDIGPGIFGADE